MLEKLLKPAQQKTLLLRGLSIAKVPLLAACTPSVIEISESQSVVKIPLRFMTKNHVGSMYFGALSMGAELSVALPVVVEVFEKKRPLNFLFTDFQCEFHSKAKEDIYFVFEGVEKMNQMMGQLLSEGGSDVCQFEGKAFLKSQWKERKDPVMSYKVGISLKSTRK